MTRIWLFWLVSTTVVVLAIPGTAKKPSGECLPIGDETIDPTTITSQFQCVATRNSIPCVDEDPLCTEWAERGECKQNPQYMIYNCRAACETCVSLHLGETQTAPTVGHVDEVMNILLDTQQYVYDRASVRPNVLKSCVNDHSMCSYWAAQGECKSNPAYMNDGCKAACKKCR